MRKIKDGQVRGKYTLGFKLETVRLVKEVLLAVVTAYREFAGTVLDNCPACAKREPTP